MKAYLVTLGIFDTIILLVFALWCAPLTVL